MGTADILPAVAVHSSVESVTLEFLKKKLQDFACPDDVFTSNFTHGGLVLVQTVTGTDNGAQVEPDVQKYLDSLSAQLVVQASAANGPLPEGPCFVVDNCMHQAWRLYEDTLEAFVSATVPVATIDQG